MVEWIEIYGISPLSHISWVSTLVVEWIEIVKYVGCGKTGYVSTLVVEWIEIPRRVPQWYPVMSLHPRGGVD